MQKVNSPPHKWRQDLFPLVALLILTADQFSKLWIRTYPEGQVIFQAGFFRIVHIRNTGAAFGLFPDQRLALIIVGVIGVSILLLCSLYIYRYFAVLSDRLSRVALGLILAGTLGNLVERINPNIGSVTDFISIGVWPTFNIADMAIDIGAIIFVYSLYSLTIAGRGRDG